MRTIGRKRSESVPEPPELPDPVEITPVPIQGYCNWLGLLEDRLGDIPPDHFVVLAAFGRILNWTSGTGYASLERISERSKRHPTTVKRALAWARQNGYAIQTRRGGRAGDGSIWASEWQLSQPQQLSQGSIEDSQQLSQGSIEDSQQLSGDSQQLSGDSQQLSEAASTDLPGGPPSNLTFIEPKIQRTKDTRASALPRTESSPSGVVRFCTACETDTSEEVARNGIHRCPALKKPESEGATWHHWESLRFGYRYNRSKIQRERPGSIYSDDVWLSEEEHKANLAALGDDLYLETLVGVSA